jgi:hypothetical protein
MERMKASPASPPLQDFVSVAGVMAIRSAADRGMVVKLFNFFKILFKIHALL